MSMKRPFNSMEAGGPNSNKRQLSGGMAGFNPYAGMAGFDVNAMAAMVGFRFGRF